MRPIVRLCWPSAILAACLGACSGAPPSTAPTPIATISTATLVPRTLITPSPTPPLPVLATAWQASGHIAGKTVTYWPAIDPKTGDVWVADSFHDDYWVFQPDGTFVAAWGSSGSGDGQFHLTTSDPSPDAVGAIAFAPDGSFYVADEGNHRIQKFDAQSRYVTQWGTFGTGDGQFVQAKGIATDGTLVYVADDPRQDMQVFDASGRFLRSFPFPSIFFVLDRSGHLWTAGGNDGSAVLEFDGTGHQVASFDYAAVAQELGGGGGPAGVDRAGNIYVVIDRDPLGPAGIIELGRTGGLLAEWSNPCGSMTVTPDATAIYCAYDGPLDGGWPYIRKYLLPAR